MAHTPHATGSTRRAGWPLLLAAALFLGACGSPQPRPDPDEKRPATGSARPGGGGYYLDDGPGDNPPPDLDKIPDAVPRAEPLHRFANRPYTVFGRTYTPMDSLRPYRERGVASWYGRRYHNQRTSSGEPYDMYAMTAAHPTLPIPSYVRVTNPANGRSVVLRVNDRGPFKRERIIDLSYTAAYKLDYLQHGSTEVEVELIRPGINDSASTPVASLPPPLESEPLPPLASPAPIAPPRPALPATGGVFLQLGVFSSAENAHKLMAQANQALAQTGRRARVVADDGRHRVHVGPWDTPDEARLAARDIGRSLALEPIVVQR